MHQDELLAALADLLEQDTLEDATVAMLDDVRTGHVRDALVVILPHHTLQDGRIIPNVRTWTVCLTVSAQVNVHGLEARTSEEAQEQALEQWARDVLITTTARHWDIEDASVESIDDVVAQ